MAWRIVGGLGLVVAWLVGTLLGVAGAALRTDAGRQLVVAEGLRYANARLGGTLTVGAVSGGFITGLVLDDVVLRDTAGVAVVAVDRVTARYRVRDLLSGRVSLGQLILERPRADLIQRTPGARFNFEEALPSGGGGGRSPLIAFTDVRVSRGHIMIRTPDENVDGAPNASDGGPNRRYREREISDLSARLPYLRLSSPDPDEDAIVVEIASLAAHVSDPAVGLAYARGRIDVWGDSLTLNLPALTLAETNGALRGSLRWGTDTLLLDLDARASRLVTDEIRGLAPDVPAALSGRGDFLIRSLSGDVLEITGTDVRLEGMPQGGTVAGRLAMVVGPGEEWAARQTRLELSNFDLEFVRALLDTLPLAGRVDGRVEASGPRDRLNVVLDVAFRDSLVEGWPETTVRASGVVELGHPDGAVFHGFQLRETDVALSTVQRMVPGLPLVGRLRLAGTLVGPWTDATFAGDVRHEDAPLPPSEATGSVRFDIRGAVLGVWADLELDSLRLAGLSSRYPQLDRDLRLAGHLEVAGLLDSLRVTADLSGPPGRFVAEGALYVEERRTGAHDLGVVFTDLDLSMLWPGAPATVLAGRASVRGGTAEGRPPDLRADVALDGASIEGVWIDSLRAVVSLGDSVITLNTLRAWAGELTVRGGGRIGLAQPRGGTLTLSAEADSIGELEPWLVGTLGELEADAPRGSGSFAASVTIDGALDAFDAEGAFQAVALRRGGYYVSRLDGRLEWTRGRHVSASARLDSIGVGDLGFGAAEVRVAGRSDSLAWFARSRFGGDGAWLGGGTLARDSQTTRVTIDSLGLLLGRNIWFAEPGAVVSVTDSGIDFRDVVVASVQHAGRLRVTGRLPFSGPGALSASIEALPVRDLWVLLQRDPERVSGEVNGTLEVRGRARDPEIDLRIGLREAVFGEFRAPVVRAEAQYRARRLSGDVTLHRAGEEILNVNVDLPLDLALTQVERRRLPGAVEVRAVAQGVDLALLEATSPMVRRVSGRLDADFGVTGSWERPELTGRVEISDGAAVFPSLGVRHEQLNARLRLRGDSILVDHFVVSSGQGTAQIRGFVRLEELSRPILRLSVSGQNFRAIDVRDFLTLTASGELDVTGPFLNATLTGRATANRGALYFADLVQKNVINLQDTLFREFLDTLELQRLGLGPELESRFLDSLRVDSVRVEMGSDMWMRSSEANIQLTGTVTVNKVRDVYRLNGALQTPRGTYRLVTPPPAPISKEFSVTRGQVRYFGTPDLDADLDISGRHVLRSVRGEQITVFVHIGGTLYQPRLTLSSDLPSAVSETEIISYLLFGAPSVQALGGTSGAQSQAVQTIAGIVSGQFESALISDIGFPVDYLQIRPADVGGGFTGTEVAAGWQIMLLGTTAFVTASPRICPREGVPLRFGGSLEFRLKREWVLSASVDPSRTCAAVGSANEVYQFGLDLFWETSF